MKQGASWGIQSGWMASTLRFFSISFLIAGLAPAPGSFAGVLDDYVAKPDNHYALKVGTDPESLPGGATLHSLRLTSQKWREHVWEHNLVVVRPATMRHTDIAFIFITGTTSGKKTAARFQVLADRAGAMVAVLTDVPNQPLYNGKTEDALIAFTFDRFLKTGDTDWPLLLPMAKSAVKAMDALQTYATQRYQESIKRFVVAGASKRGWTTWLTAAVDTRVVAMAPMVIDMLNMKTQIKWADAVYGEQSEKIHDYTELNLHLKMDYPAMIKLRGMVDPFSYRKRFTMPKLILLGTNDPYWTVDSLRHYWDELPGPKLVYQTPNAGHDLGGGKEATQTLAAFFQMIADKQPLPKVKWKFKANGDDEVTVSVSSNQKAKSVHLWQSESSDRDFRNDKWSRKKLHSKSNGKKAEMTIEAPRKGYRAYLAELVLTATTGHEYKVSTEARVTPDNIQLKDEK